MASMKRSRFGATVSSRSLVTVVALLLVGAAQTARAHRDGADNGPNCNGVGVGVSLIPFHADGTTPLGSDSVSNCETLVFKSTVNYQNQNTCAFESGTLTLTTPDGMAHIIAGPPGSPNAIPCVGGSANDPASTT